MGSLTAQIIESEHSKSTYTPLQAIIMLNIQGMNPALSSKSCWKTPYLEEFIRDTPEFVPFVSVTETWVKQYNTDGQMTIRNYNLFRTDRRSRIRGGVALYIHNSIVVDDYWSFDNKFCEVGIAHLKSSSTVIIVLYRPQDTSLPNFTDALQFIRNHMNSLDDSYTYFITGDFNFPDANWDTFTAGSGCTKATSDSVRLLFNLMEKYLLDQIVNTPTRTNPNNILDLFITNRNDVILDVLSTKSSLSDHNVVKIPISYSFDEHFSPPCSNISEERSFRNLDFTKANYDLIAVKLNTFNWSDVQSASPETFPERFQCLVLDVCYEYVPIKQVTYENAKHCKKKRSANMARKKRKLLARIFALKFHNPKSSKIAKLESQLHSIEEERKNKIITSKAKHEQKAISTIKSNPSFFYRYVKKFARTKSRIGPLKHPCGSATADPKTMANILQEQYISAFSDPQCPDKQDPTFAEASVSLSEIKFSSELIAKAIDEINMSSAAGEDGFPSCLLKMCKDSLCEPIYLIWKESFNSGHIPSSLKRQLITPVFKKGSRLLPSNYRPIALTSNIIKIFERVIRSQLVSYLETHHLISNNQHGFRKGFSCLSELLCHYEEVLSHVNNDYADTDVLYLDFAKAFDKVDHSLLLQKLLRYGIKGKLHKWISSFLKDRFQSVIVDGMKSYPALVLSGVPQGTVLGPILFIIFMNDIELSVKNSNIKCFADDSRLSKSIQTADDRTSLQEDLNNVLIWAKHNNMSLNENKFELLQYHASSRNFNVLIELPFVVYENCYLANSTLIEPVDVVTDLGVSMGRDFSFRTHICDIVKKARNKFSWILSSFKTRSVQSILTLFKSLVRPILEYCCVVWCPSTVSDISLLEGVQRTVTSKIVSVNHLNYWDRLKELKLMSLQRRNERYTIIYMYKILHNKVPNHIGVVFQNNARLGIKAKIPSLPRFKNRLSLYDASFSVCGPILWNLVPKVVNSAPSFNIFKNELDKFIMMYPDCPPINGYVTANSNSLTSWV